MKTYVIGDLQGCAHQSALLQERIAEQAGPAPSILFVGDLVNRGPDSLAALRRVYALERASNGRIDAVLGNHDLHLLAVAAGAQALQRSDTLADILGAPERDDLIDWLRHRPMAMLRQNHLIVHAGVAPQWSVARTMDLASEVETVLRGPDWGAFLCEMYGNTPKRWDDALTGSARLRCSINALTRIRLCRADGTMDFKQKERARAPEGSGLMPWFDVPGRGTADTTVVFGHWSALGLLMRPNLLGVDSGCVWGGHLSAVCLDDRSLIQVACPQHRKPGGAA